MKKLLLSFLLTAGFVIGASGAEITVYLKNNSAGTQISDVIILGRTNRGNGEWTTLWGGQKSSRNAKDESFGYGELRKYVFKASGMGEYEIRYTVKQGELNLVEDYWRGMLFDGSVFVMVCPGGRCSMTMAPKLAPKRDRFGSN